MYCLITDNDATAGDNTITTTPEYSTVVQKTFSSRLKSAAELKGGSGVSKIEPTFRTFNTRVSQTSSCEEDDDF